MLFFFCSFQKEFYSIYSCLFLGLSIQTEIEVEISFIQQKIIQMIGKEKQSLSGSPGKNSARQYRLEINKFTEGQPQGQFIAYCVASKESSMGLFVHQRLLVFNSAKAELSYYSDIPYLPLHTIKQLGKPKETVNCASVKRFQFALQRIRIGHVNVRWTEKNETKSWKLIMGSNKLAQQFSQLITDTLTKHKRPHKESSPNQKTSRLAQSPLRRQEKQNKLELVRTQERLQQSPKGPQSSKKKIQNIQPVSVTQQIKKAERQSKEYFNLNYTSLSIEKQAFKQTQPVNYQSYHVLNPFRIPDFSANEPIQKNINLVKQWLEASSGRSRAQIYQQFILICEKKIQALMENFFSAHLKHEEEDGYCVLYDGEINYTYCPLLEQLQCEESAKTLVERATLEQNCWKEWESLSYLSGFDRIGGTRVIVPMACIVTFKSVKFYCKSSIDYYNSKRYISENEDFSGLLTELQQKTHIKLKGGRQRIYILDNQHIYIDRANFLPHLSNKLPVTSEYIERYISKGVICSQKDLQAIKKHIQIDLSNEIITKINQKQLSSSFQMAEVMKQYGLSHHYLPLMERKASKGYFTRIIMSEMVSFSLQLQIRRKMQLQLFKKKDFGFSINQFKKSINSLFQSHKNYLQLIKNIIEEYFNVRYDLQACPIDTYILGEAVLSEVLLRLGLDCQIFVKDNQLKGWIWKEENILDNMQISAFSRTKGYRWACFSYFPQSFIEKQLFQEINYDLKHETSLQSVLQFLRMQKDSSGYIDITPQYNLLEPKLRIQVDYFCSHYLVPTLDGAPQTSLNSAIYKNFKRLHYNVHSLEFMTVLNHIRWLIKGKHFHQAEKMVYESIDRAVIWNQVYALIQIYAFYAQYKLKMGEIEFALEFSHKALKSASDHFQQERTLLLELLIAEQAFEIANIYFGVQDYSKSLEYYTNTQIILKKINTKGDKISLNPQFLLLYYRKCQIYLLFGQYQNCLDECLQGLECSTKIKNEDLRLLVDAKELKMYEVLFRCYDIQKMRKEMIEVSEICSHKYFQDRILINQPVDENVLGEIIKMVWIGIIKQVEIVSPVSNQIDEAYEQIQYIYLKKLRKQLLSVARYAKLEQKYSMKEASQYLRQRIQKKIGQRVENRLKGQIILCMVEASTKSLSVREGKLLSDLSLQSDWAMFEVLACLTSFDFLIGSLEMSLHLYSFQY